MYNQIGYWSQIAGLRDFHEYNVWLDVLNVHVRYQREISARPYRRKIVTFGSISVWTCVSRRLRISFISATHAVNGDNL